MTKQNDGFAHHIQRMYDTEIKQLELLKKANEVNKSDYLDVLIIESESMLDKLDKQLEIHEFTTINKSRRY